MNPLLMIIMIIVAVLVTGFLVYFAYILFIFLAVSKKINLRYDFNPLLKYFTHEDFPGLKAEPFAFKTKHHFTLRGNIYTTDEVKNFNQVILFFHGLGPGHLAYTKEINRLARDNHMAVIAYDNLGTGLSEGKTIKDISWALVDAEYYLNFSKQDPRFAQSELILVGHSWGGYVASNIYQLNPDQRIKKMVVINGLPSVVDVSTRYTKGKALAKIIFRFLAYLKLGRYANHSILKTLKEHQIKALVVHGALDPIVPLQFLLPLVKFAGSVNYIHPLIYPHHHHFAYLSPRAEEALMEMQRDLKRFEKDKIKLKDYCARLNYDLIGEHYDPLFISIKQFISEE